MKFNRRDALKSLGGALGLSLLPRLAHTAANQDKMLLVINAVGGLRAMDIFDAHAPGAYGSQVVDTPYTMSQCTQISGDWYMPPWGSPLLPYTGHMALVRNVYMETAAHGAGQRIAIKGVNRTLAPAAPVLASNLAPYDFGANSGQWALPGLSFARNLEGAGMPPPLAAEPTVMVDLFAGQSFTDDAALDAMLAAAIGSHNQGLKTEIGPKSRIHDWIAHYQATSAQVSANLATKINPEVGGFSQAILQSTGLPPGDIYYARRFAAAFLAFKNRVSPVVTLELPGFDTHVGHNSTMGIAGGRLVKLLADLIDRLQLEGLFDDTIIYVASDFGRTPAYNPTQGTDHWTSDSVALFFGANASLSPSVVFGKTNYPGEIAHPSYPAAPYRRKDVWATLLAALGVPNISSWLPLSKPIQELLP